MNSEDQLQNMLRRRASGAVGGPDFDQVRARAKGIRRRRRAVAAAAVAAAVVVVTVPTALLLQGGPDAATQLPSHSGSPTPSPRPSPTTTPTSGTQRHGMTLSEIPRGANPLATYLDANGVVHGAGSQQPLPGGAANVTSFEAFKGGWVVRRDDGTLSVYDGSGAVTASGNSNGGIATTSDNTQVAYQIGTKVYYGAGSTMGNGGPSATTVSASDALIGFLPTGPAVTDGSRLTVLAPGATTVPIPGGFAPSVTSDSADLVGGITGTVASSNLAGAMYDPKTHTVLWSNNWNPVSFSYDGKYVAAYPVEDNGDPATWAILDARTGKVVAQLPKLASNVYLGWDVTWQDDKLLIVAAQGANHAAMLALTPAGLFTRVSDVVPVKTGAAGFVFAAGN